MDYFGKICVDWHVYLEKCQMKNKFYASIKDASIRPLRPI